MAKIKFVQIPLHDQLLNGKALFIKNAMEILLKDIPQGFFLGAIEDIGTATPHRSIRHHGEHVPQRSTNTRFRMPVKRFFPQSRPSSLFLFMRVKRGQG